MQHLRPRQEKRPGQGQSSRLLLLKLKIRGHPLVPQAWPPFQSLCALGPLVHSPLTTGGKGLCVPGVAGMTLCKAGKPRSTWTATRTAQAPPLQSLLNATRADPKTSVKGGATRDQSHTLGPPAPRVYFPVSSVASGRAGCTKCSRGFSLGSSRAHTHRSLSTGGTPG